MNPSTALATVLVDELVRCGVQHAVLCPGSRNAPLSFALHAAEQAGRLILHVRIDERSAGFLALGLALRSGLPVPVACTSGTAAANLHPAVLEAHHAGIPLLAVTADRPAELVGTGANQTVRQTGIFGAAVRAAPSLSGAVGLCAARAVEITVDRASRLPWGNWAAARGRCISTYRFANHWCPRRILTLRLIRGPRRWRLFKAVQPRALDGGGRRGTAARRSGAGPGPAHLGSRGSRRATWRRWGCRWWPSPPRPVGPMGWPPGRGCSARRRSSSCDPNRCWCLAAPPCIGRWHGCSLTRRWRSPSSPTVRSGPMWRAPPVAVGTALRCVGSPDPDWLRRWRQADERAAAAVCATVRRHPRATGLGVARRLVAALPAGALLLLGSSNPIRDVSLAARPRRGLTVLANRGVAGIDGTIATATGAALAHGGPGYALVGDLTFLHDRTGCWSPRTRPAQT